MIACVRILHFAATVLCQEAQAAPLLVVRYSRDRGRVVGVSAAAEQAGVTPGMPVSRARALCTQAQIVPLAPAKLRRALDELQHSLSVYSQWIDTERGGLQTAFLYCDLGRLRPSEGQQYAQEILAQFRMAGFNAAVGLAANKFTARVAAVTTAAGTVRLVRRGEEAAFLAPLPVTLLPLEQDIARRLALLGLGQIGQLAALPGPALIAQFGTQGGKLHRLACGEDPRRVGRYIPPVSECAARQFEPPLDDTLVLQSVLGALSGQLIDRLAQAGFSCREITLTVRLEDHREHEAQRRPRAAISSGRALAQTLYSLLKTLRLNARIVEVSVQLGRLAPTLPRQLGLFDSLEAQDPREALLDIAERYGEDCFYSVTVNPLGAHVPEWQFVLEKVAVA